VDESDENKDISRQGKDERFMADKDSTSDVELNEDDKL
jgi:hypothetical protein